MVQGAVVHMAWFALLRWSCKNVFGEITLKHIHKSLQSWSVCTKYPMLEEMLKHICFRFPNEVSVGIKNIL